MRSHRVRTVEEKKNDVRHPQDCSVKFCVYCRLCNESGRNNKAHLREFLEHWKSMDMIVTKYKTFSATRILFMS